MGNKEKEYIDSVDGEAHMSAVRIIRELEANDKVLQDYIRAREEYDVACISDELLDDVVDRMADAWEALKKLKHD